MENKRSIFPGYLELSINVSARIEIKERIPLKFTNNILHYSPQRETLNLIPFHRTPSQSYRPLELMTVSTFHENYSRSHENFMRPFRVYS